MLDLIAQDAIRVGLKLTSKKQVLQELSSLAHKATGIEEKTICRKLMDREKLGTTGVGHGVAIPHARFTDIDTVKVFFLKLHRGVDFEAIDDQPVDLVCMLMAPEGTGTEHLGALARISRMLRDQEVITRLRGCETAEAVWAILSDYEMYHPNYASSY